MWLHGHGGGGEVVEEGHGWELIGALGSGGDVRGDVVREGEGDDGGGGVIEGLGYERVVGGGGEDGDGDAAAEEEVGEVEKRDSVAFGHEWEENNVWWRRAMSSAIISHL